jgi:hypothetical protein
MNKAITGLAAGLATAAGLVLTATTADAASGGDSCPLEQSGFALWDIATEPYGVDNSVDAKGNGDGWVCARPIYVVTDENGEPFQIYNFLDNKFAARG